MNPVDWYSNTKQYFSEVESEYKKITWPAQREAAAGAVGVVVVVTIITIVLGVVDLGLSRIMQWLLQ